MFATKSRYRRVVSLVGALTLGPVIAGLALIGPATAADLSGCAAISGDQERLACYDRASGRVASAPAVLAEPAVERTAMSAPSAAGGARPKSSRSDSMIDAAWSFNPDSSRYLIGLYRPNYIQVARYTDRPNNEPFKVLFDALEAPDAERQRAEAEFQLSFKTRLWATDDRRFGVWAAYTQQSQWQIYNEELSRPFRETNYQPELFVSYRPDLSLGNFHWRLLNFGYNHQSNGRGDPISRSWDRLIAEFGIERDNFAVLIRPWLVINDGGDDNPEITDYYGYGDITGVYQWKGSTFTLMGRGNLGTGKGAARFTWTTPPLLGPLRGYVDAFAGYGESMIDYDWYQNSIGIGVALNGLLDRPVQNN